MTAARILGIGRTKAYELSRRGECPCLVIRVGDLYRVSTADLLRLLGTSADPVQAPPPAAYEHVVTARPHGQTIKSRVAIP
ncbi:MAG: helix-turn-helix domain-containing protein [Streptosporangiaceae bacterium]|jgi:hypothetical protein